MDVDIHFVLEAMAEDGVLAGFDLSTHDANLKNCLLVCVTEVKTESDLEIFKQSLVRALDKGER